MKIVDVSCIAIKDDGTILAKTIMDQNGENYRYAYHVVKNQELLYKEPYSKNSYLLYKANEHGRYKIKAFVRSADGAEKVTQEVFYTVDNRNAPKLPNPEKPDVPKEISLSVRIDANGALTAVAEGDFNADASYGWYLYEEGVSEPVQKISYSGDSSLHLMLDKHGTYSVKVFIKEKGKKYSKISSKIYYL